MKIIYGDLIDLAKEGKFDVIVHGCNCFCKMGAGIAKYIKQEFPEAYDVDRETGYGVKSKLGDLSYVQVQRDRNKIIIVNGYTQYTYFENGPLVEYDAVRKVFKKVKLLFFGFRIGYPKIGAGLAGGDWNIIEKIINEELYGEDHTLVVKL
jgi:O-acetyl-ADP-ribose deacetylase (regulator of RNase III)